MNQLRIRTGLAILLSFALSTLLFHYAVSPDSPSLDFLRMRKEASALPQTIAGRILASLPRPELPSFGRQPPPIARIPPPASTAAPTAPLFPPAINDSLKQRPTLPTVPPLPPSMQTPARAVTPLLLPTTAPPPETPTDLPDKPTKTPKPPKKLKPTAVPKLTLEARRPGNSFDEVVSIVSPIMCVPEPMLWAILHNEYGPWLPQVEADWDNRNTMSGTDATAAQGNTSVTGVTQMMGDTWFRIKPYVMAKFTVQDMSLSVTFDSIAAAAYHLRNVSLAGQDHDPCDDWDAKRILYAACRYNGACPSNTYGQSQYYNKYTYDVCNAYNRFTKGPQKICK